MKSNNSNSNIDYRPCTCNNDTSGTGARREWFLQGRL